MESLNHIVGFAVPIAGYYLWGGGTGAPIPINYSKTGFLYRIKVGDLTFKPIDPLTGGKLEWIGDTGLNLTVTNITADAYVDLQVYLLWVIPMWGLRVNFNDLNVTAAFDFSKMYNRYPQLSLDLDLKYSSFDWKFFIVGWIVKLFVKEETLINFVVSAIEGAVDGLSESMRSRDSDGLLVNVMKDLSVNLGFTRPFTLDKENDLFTFNLDGRVYNTTTGMYGNEIVQKTAVRFPRAHSNQIFVHQSTAQAAIRSLKHIYMPIEVEDPSFNQLLGIYIPELFEKFGATGSFKIAVDSNDDFDVRFTLDHGISMMNVGLDVTIYGKSTGYLKSYQEAMTFSLTLDLEKVDVHIQELVVHTHIGDSKVSNAFMTKSSIGNIVRNNWDQFFETLINFKLNEININNKEFDIKSLDAQIDLISGQIPNSTVAFDYQDEFMYIGMRFFNDD